MKRLIAKKDILYECKYYEKGDMLPVKEPNMVQAWLDCGSAEWQGDDAEDVFVLNKKPTEQKNEEEPVKRGRKTK